MARITVEDCLERENNRFALVQLAAKRTKQILGGAKSLVQSSNKAVVTALREIASNKVRFMTPEEAEIAREIAEKEQAAAAERQSELLTLAVSTPSPDSIMKSADDKIDDDDEEDDIDDEELDDIDDEEDEIDDESDDDDSDEDEKKTKDDSDDAPGRNGDSGGSGDSEPDA